ncbi:MFS transporter [Micromonospora chersina]|uniref:Major Facilitator Superfamily protein n=1 Tax=Micromonospora chersina TaxID=47854 RepID=A0A1C6VZY1_9ACTN|nr:MFS transporter [Micromonospora chersina]SCL71891.1 Major Facilitator Superfamily protein [Micromonospora chersina]
MHRRTETGLLCGMGASKLSATLVRQVVPPPGVTRPLATLALVYSCGSGIFAAGSPIFFTRVVGLTPVEVGLGISVGAAVSVLASVPLGVLMDRAGVRLLWIASAILEALAFASYPFVRGLAGFLIVVAVLAAVHSLSRVAVQVYSLAAFPPAERVRAQAYQRTALNVGFTLGGAAAGLAMAFDTVLAYQTMVWGTAAVVGLCIIVVARLPRLDAPAPESALARKRGRSFRLLRDPSVLSVSGLAGALHANEAILSLLLPLWIISRTDAPTPMVATLFVLNAVLVVVFQVRTSRGAETAGGAARALRHGGLFTALACLLFGATIWTADIATIAVLVAGTVALTLGEMTNAVGAWGTVSALSPPERRGEYIGVFELGDRLQRLSAPVAFVALALGTGGGAWGWLVIAGVFVVAASLIGVTVSWAERRRPTPPDSTEDRENPTQLTDEHTAVGDRGHAPAAKPGVRTGAATRRS